MRRVDKDRPVLGGALLTLCLYSGVGEVSAATPAQPAPPMPQISVEDGLAIGRHAKTDRRLGEFTPRSDGGYDYTDPQRRFRAEISEDGRVNFQKMSPVRDVGYCNDGGECVTFRGFRSFLRDPGRWRELSKQTANNLGRKIDAPDLTPSPLLFGLGFRFGRSLLSGRLKAEFLRDTQALRLDLATKAEHRRIIAALASVETHLQEIWRSKHIPLRRRRELLFQLWDDSIDIALSAQSKHDDDLSSSLAELRERAAAEARSRIIDFIQTRLPAGHALSYTEEEIRRFNARRLSRDVFAPYPSNAQEKPR